MYMHSNNTKITNQMGVNLKRNQQEDRFDTSKN